MNEQQINDLFKNHTEGKLGDEQRIKLESWYLEQARQSDYIPNHKELKLAKTKLRSALPLKYKSSPIIISFTIAASILIALGIGIVVYIQQHAPAITQKIYANDIAPGQTSAMLTLADGSKIKLSEAVSGEIAAQEGVSIRKTAAGKIIYTITGNSKKGIGYNSISTADGAPVEVQLPEGSVAWLNASSKLSFPTSFNGSKNRVVELEGEAYFEIAKNKKQPFIVHTTAQQIKVLGTHFNVNSYADDAETKTTLLEGSVMVNSSLVIKPGEQVTGSANTLKKSKADVELAVAWKNNKFMFENEKIENIMKMVKRYYNVEVVYSGEIPDDLFGGSVSRFDKVSKVLGILELTGNVHFKIEGRRITVMK